MSGVRRSARLPAPADQAGPGEPMVAAAEPGRQTDGDVLVQVENLVKYFPVRTASLVARTAAQVKAVDGVSLTLRCGQTLGLVGGTGCGKSTLARCIAGLIPVTSGRVAFDERDITNLPGRAMQPVRREVQMIFRTVRHAQSASPGGRDHRRPVRCAQDRRRSGAQARLAGTDGAGRAESRALQPVSRRVLRRSAAAHRAGQGADAAAEADHRRRAGVRRSMYSFRRRSSTCSPTCRTTSGSASCSSRTTWRWCGMSATRCW